ncbi:sorting nexin 13 [Rhizopus stolonifer]|uniref:Sorting nexin 13 n=2 Tax=Mucorineae TaxID=1344963 RepID=A0A367KMH0_RHIST|nr:sorting nexin 13 [Rhizopus stolonifer]
MRECRALEESELSMKDFVNSNPQSPFAQLLSREEQHNQLCGLSQVFLKRTLPAADRDSLLLSSLLKEILANFVLENIVSSISNPDFLNRQIVDLLSNKDTKNSIQSTVSSIVLSNSTAEITSDEDLLGYSVVQKPIINDDLNATSKSDGFDMQQVTPPSSPEANNPLKPTPINTSPPKTETTMLASLQSPPPPPSLHGPPTMVFPRGSVNFTIMNISSLQQNDQTPDKKELVYIIQIERPAMEDQAGSEGGGYVITRTYADFESFHTILFAKHPKRITRIQLKLPLEAAAKSWLKKPSTQQKRKVSLEAVGQGLQKYLDTVVQDDELGTEQLILPFLRKETRSEIAEDGAVMSFSEEFQNEVASSIALIEASTVAQPSRSRSLFSRSNSTAALNVPSTTNKTDHASPEERQSMDQDAPGKWFAPRTKPRQGSFSSTHSNLSKDSAVTVTKEDHDEPNERLSNSTSSLGSQQEAEETTKPTNKALSSMDVELLIETTYALVVEIFNLTTSNNKAWMRRSILNLLREIVRRSYTEFISEQYSDFVNQYMSPNAIVSRLNQLGEQLWPEGKWMLDQKEQTKRTQEDKEKSKYQARTLMMRELIPNAVRQLIGEQNCNTAMDRMWARIQDPDLNRVLILQVLERIIKPILG